MDSVSPLARPVDYGVLEVDAFCTRCNYNLHGQAVTIDERLGFPICRCPECGTFHPAGTGVTASTIWVRRLASALLFFWIAIVVTGVLGTIGGFCLLCDASVEAFTYEMATTAAPNHWRFQMQLNDWRARTTPEVAGFSVMIFVSAASLIAGFIAGTLCVTLLWHWKFSRYFDMVFVPLVSAAFMVVVFYTRVDFDLIRLQCSLHVLSQTGLQSLGILMGILLGRKISRFIITAIIPPKTRQALAFLWRVDGKDMPSSPEIGR